MVATMALVFGSVDFREGSGFLDVDLDAESVGFECSKGAANVIVQTFTLSGGLEKEPFYISFN